MSYQFNFPIDDYDYVRPQYQQDCHFYSCNRVMILLLVKVRNWFNGEVQLTIRLTLLFMDVDKFCRYDIVFWIKRLVCGVLCLAIKSQLFSLGLKNIYVLSRNVLPPQLNNRKIQIEIKYDVMLMQ